MKLKELLQGVPILAANVDLETEIGSVHYDSRTVPRRGGGAVREGAGGGDPLCADG